MSIMIAQVNLKLGKPTIKILILKLRKGEREIRSRESATKGRIIVESKYDRDTRRPDSIWRNKQEQRGSNDREG